MAKTRKHVEGLTVFGVVVGVVIFRVFFIRMALF